MRGRLKRQQSRFREQRLTNPDLKRDSTIPTMQFPSISSSDHLCQKRRGEMRAGGHMTSGMKTSRLLSRSFPALEEKQMSGESVGLF